MSWKGELERGIWPTAGFLFLAKIMLPAVPPILNSLIITELCGKTRS